MEKNVDLFLERCKKIIQIVHTSIRPYSLNTITSFYFMTECPDIAVLVWGRVQATTYSYLTRPWAGWALFLNMQFIMSYSECSVVQVLQVVKQLC